MGWLFSGVLNESQRQELIETCRRVIESRARFTFMDVARAMVTVAEVAGELPAGANCTPGQLALHLGINRQTQANWRSRDLAEWMKRMRESLAPLYTVVAAKGEGRRRRLTVRHWEFVAEISSRHPGITWDELARRVREAAGKESSGVPELRMLSRVTAWRNRYRIQEFVAALERRRAENEVRKAEVVAEKKASPSGVGIVAGIIEPKVEQQQELKEAIGEAELRAMEEASGGGVELEEPPSDADWSGGVAPDNGDPW